MQEKRNSKLENKKVFIAIVFGLIGFFVNFLSIDFIQFPDFKVNILMGLIFPLFIALFWGWRYGLISAIAGGCQTMWILWYTDGYGVLYSVPVYTLWIVWHGWWADYRNSHQHHWYYSMYIVEIVFRIVIELGFLTIFRLLVSFNPPVWDSQLTNNFVALDWIGFVAKKHLITSYVMILMVDVLLHVKPLRKIFGINQLKAHAKTTYIISIALIIGCLLWITQAIVDYYIFHPGYDSFLNICFVNIPPCSLFTRHLFLFTSLISGLLLSRFYMATKEKEELYKKSQAQFKSFVETSPDMIFILNKSAEITYLNPQAYDYFDDVQSMVGKSIFLFVSPGYLDIVRNNFMKGISGEITPPYEVSLNTKLPEQIFFEIHATVVRDSDNSITGRIAIFRDITKRLKDEREIIDNNMMLNKIIETIPNGIVITDEHGLITYANNVAEKILVLDHLTDSNKTYNDPAWNITDREGNPFSEEDLPFNIVKTTGKSVFNVEHCIQREDIERKTLKINAAPILDADHHFLKMVASIEDITKDKELMEELVLYRKNLETLVVERTADLEEKNKTMQYYLNLFENREIRIKELKNKISELEKKISEAN